MEQLLYRAIKNFQAIHDVLTQEKTFPADIAYAIYIAIRAIEEIEAAETKAKEAY